MESVTTCSRSTGTQLDGEILPCFDQGTINSRLLNQKLGIQVIVILVVLMYVLYLYCWKTNTLGEDIGSVPGVSQLNSSARPVLACFLLGDCQ